eukprot:TRINITY_DN25358_c0_g1_i2.p1 TRINITY_DN25358_c0_g1~~TRINITY_DN25358_c0_g1_i2.p1  ORF type:complete len:285 (+),score=32.99 TRINITY_DN25358_c0_g1_i2:55-855(+)
MAAVRSTSTESSHLSFDDDPHRSLEIMVCMLNGHTGVVITVADEKMGRLRRKIGAALGLRQDCRVEPPVFEMYLLPSPRGGTRSDDKIDAGTQGKDAGYDKMGKVLRDDSPAWEAADGIVLVILGVEPENCVSKRFRHELVVSCGTAARAMDKATVEILLDLRSGGRFSFQRHYHQSTGSASLDEMQYATGRWAFRADDKDQDGGVILLSGDVVITTKTLERGAARETTKKGPFSTSFLRRQLVGGRPTSRGKWTSEDLDDDSVEP